MAIWRLFCVERLINKVFSGSFMLTDVSNMPEYLSDGAKAYVAQYGNALLYDPRVSLGNGIEMRLESFCEPEAIVGIGEVRGVVLSDLQAGVEKIERIRHLFQLAGTYEVQPYAFRKDGLDHVEAEIEKLERG